MLATRSQQEITYVSMADPALDLEKTGDVALKEYMRAFEEKHLVLKPGQVPTRFKLSRLSRKAFLASGVVYGQALSAQQQNDIVAQGLKGVENWGESLVFELNASRDRVSEETLNKLYAPPLWHELANVILGISGLRPLDE